MTPIAIQTEQLSYKCGNHYLIKAVDWLVHQGEHWLVFGLNGSGKTTLLSLIAGYCSFTQGAIQIFGEPMTKDTVLSLRQKIGYVSSSYFKKYYTKESVLDIILSGKFATLGIDYAITDDDVRQAKTLLSAFHLKKIAAHPFGLLSNGEQQIVLTARALMAKPDILLMDETCAGLDIYTREYLLNFVKLLAHETNITLIFVTHYPEEILPEFDHCLLLKDGKKYASGATKDIFTTDTISQFINQPLHITSAPKGFDVHLDVAFPIKQWLTEGLLPS